MRGGGREGGSGGGRKEGQALRDVVNSRYICRSFDSATKSKLFDKGVLRNSLAFFYSLSLSVCVGSVAFTNGGRYRDNGAYGKKLYGAFTGPM